MEERSVTRAAARMDLARPTLSASQAKLRRHFGDEHLVRSGDQYRLTPLAARPGARGRPGLAGQVGVRSRARRRGFKLPVSDHAPALGSGPLAELLAAEAPFAHDPGCQHPRGPARADARRAASPGAPVDMCCFEPDRRGRPGPRPDAVLGPLTSKLGPNPASRAGRRPTSKLLDGSV
ncbi:LysR family transcriptional regulator [Actinomadura keratinilytica]|uniref:helix-turn-helix domain-containing protein n=1 Tax=Actinomadura keratinilytica TaxID=547461 RepID=UPI0031EC3E20